MKRSDLSRIYFDDLPVRLMGDEARPPLSRIVRAGGKVPGQVDVLVLSRPGDAKGQRLQPEEIIDRTVEPAKPIYLRSVPRPALGPATPVDAGDRDPVIAQLGRAPRDPPGSAARARPPTRPAAAAARQASEAQKAAEAAAEERQEEARGQEDALQDEAEALADDADDRLQQS